ncbi:MAG TPA: DUF4147 domain-containing protein [Pyrinomonadaceae bacterium]|nr:DUF4147 domain-containing protein [Pyrinomonadaceae bacterium]
MTPTGLEQLRQSAREIFDCGLRAADAREAVRQTVNLRDSQLTICDTRYGSSRKNIYVIAIGKAAGAMALGLTDVLGDWIAAGVLSSPRLGSQVTLDSRWQLFSGGHPLPNEESLRAAEASFALLKRANQEQALVIFLISGGGSAMLEYPVRKDITLADLQEANRVLVTSGANISEINSIRRAFSAVKGGQLATHAAIADQLTLIVSDTNEGDETSVASGPTLVPKQDSPKAAEVVARYNLAESLPLRIVSVINEQQRSPQPTQSNHPSYVLLSNHDALEASAKAAQRLGFAVQVEREINEQPIEEGCRLLLSCFKRLKQERPDRKVCLISGGEFSCPVRGDGIGGRNLETVLRCALEIEQSNFTGDVVVLSAGTDGIDGNSRVAGAIADQTTIPRAHNQGLDPRAFLEKSDLFRLFSPLGDTIKIGPTGTNVRDIRIILGR